MKKFVSVLLALVMTLALSVTALAAGETGSITVDNAVNGKTYTIYRIFDLNDHSSDYSAINYKVSTKWAGFFETGAKGLEYVTIDPMGYVTWNADKSAADFAAEAIKFATANNIVNDGQATAANGKVEFKNLTLGYYLVQSDLGALCSLDTTMPSVTIKEKNSESTVEKKVQEGGLWQDRNDANIGDTVNFQTTIKVIDGQPKNYVLHDKMSTGLTFKADSVVVKVGEKTLAKDTDYTLVTSGLTDGCTFEIRFTDTTADGVTASVLKPNDVVTVSYSATLNDQAVIAGAGNPNETKLTYGDNKSTGWDTTHTYTWEVKVFKYTMKNDAETPLAGAEFKLYKTVGEKTYYVMADSDKKVTGWTEDKTAGTTFTSPTSGKFTITGLDAGTYYLEETKAPAGYNLLQNPIEVVITASYNDATNVGTATITYNKDYTGEVKVENNTGTELPSTGGIGTTIFYVLGGVLMAGAFVMLVVRKRMRTE